MFDLFRSREKTVRILLGGLLLIVALSMLVYLIPGAGVPTANREGTVVAEIGSDQVTVRDVQRLVQERLRNRLTPDMVQFMIPQLIDQMISDEAVAYEAKRLGYEVSDADLASVLRSMPNLGTLPADQYRMAVEQMGYSVPEFEETVRKNSYLMYLENLALEGIIVTPQEVEKEFKRRNEKIALEYIAFDPQKIKAEIKPTPQQLQDYFTRNHNFFTTPETRAFQLIIADPAKVAASINVAEPQLQAYYDSHKDEFRTPERVNARHILFDTRNKSKEEVAKIKAQAEQVLKQIKGGGDFAELAKKWSDDPGSKAKGGDLGWVLRGQMVKNFEATTFSLKPKEISDVITTEYGFHIIQVLEKQEPHLQTLAEVRGQIISDLQKNELNDRMQNLADQAHAELVKAPQNAEQIANQLGLSFVKVDKAAPGGPLPVVGFDKPTSDTIFALKKGEVSPEMQAANRLLMAVVTDVFPAHPAEFAEVEKQIHDRYQMDEANRLVAERSKKAADMLKANGGDLKAVAKSMGLEVKKADFFNRQGAAEGIGSANYFADAFNLPAGAAVGAVNVGTQTVVAKVSEKQEPDQAKLAQERNDIVQQLKAKKADERGLLFKEAVLQRLVKEGKVKIHRDVINRVLASYRG
jgi:peptidyl-prolyl cis-trans isomerase D